MRRLLSSGVALAAVLAVGVPLIQAAPAHADPVPTTVVLSFDGTLETAATLAAPALDAHGMKGTFYVNSNVVGSDGGHLSWTDLTTLQADGHEVGGHALDMVNLTTLPVDQMHAQICQDRAVLVGHGLTVNDFAYPSGFGYETPTVKNTVAACGYDSARRAWGLYSPTNPDCTGPNHFCFDPAGPIPPTDPFAIPTPDIVQTSTDLEAIVTRADDAGGGLVPIIFQEICENNCDTYSTSPEQLSLFLDFLQTDTNVVVKTMHDALSEGAPQPLDTTAPASTIACNAAACSTDWYAGPAQVSLAATDAQSGVAGIYYTTDGNDPTNSSSVYTGPFPVSTGTTGTTVKYRAYDVAGNLETVNSQLVKADSVAPATTVTCNATTCSSGWYTDSVQVSLAATDTGGSGIKSVHYTTDGSTPTLASLTYNGPFAVSATKTVKFRAWDVAGNVEVTQSQPVDIDAVAPTSGISCNNKACSGAGWYRGSVKVALSGADGGSGVAAIHYTTDGSTPTEASPLYTAPLTLRASRNVKTLVIDNAGNKGAVRSTLVRVDATRPTIRITGPKNHASVKGSVHVSAAAADKQSGIAKVMFYVDGKLVATDTKAAYGFVWNTTRLSKKSHTLTARAMDKAGNLSAAASIRVAVH